MQAWTDDEGVTHACKSSFLAVCGAPVESLVKKPQWTQAMVTCLWCSIKKPQDLASAIVLDYARRYPLADPTRKKRRRS